MLSKHLRGPAEELVASLQEQVAQLTRQNQELLEKVQILEEFEKDEVQMAGDSQPEAVPLLLYDLLRAELEQLRQQHADAMHTLQQRQEVTGGHAGAETAHTESRDKGTSTQNGPSVPEVNGTTYPETTANGTALHTGGPVGVGSSEASHSEAALTESEATGKGGVAADAVDTRTTVIQALDTKAVGDNAESELVAAESTGGRENPGVEADGARVVPEGLAGTGITDVAATGAEATELRDTGVQATGAETTAAKATELRDTAVQATGAEAMAVKTAGVQATVAEVTGVKVIGVQATETGAIGVKATGAEATGAQATVTEGKRGEATGARATAMETNGAEATRTEGPCAAVLHPGAAAAALQAELEARILGLEEALRRREWEAAAELEAARGLLAEAEAEATQGRNRELEALRELLATATATGEHARAEAAELRRALSASEARVAELSSAHAAAREEMERMRGTWVPADEHERALGALRDHVTRLQAQLAELARRHERTSAEVFQVSALAWLL